VRIVKAGADCIKVGMGPGSARRVWLQVSYAADHRRARARARRGIRYATIADGGIRFSGDISKAIAAGAHVVMLGGLFAGTEESPGETVLYEGRTYKEYRGMGSLGAMQAGSADRYRRIRAASKLVPEGIEGLCAHKGTLRDLVFQLVRSRRRLCGAATIAELQRDTRFVRVTDAGVRESHPHDVRIAQEAPNYRVTL
jgi:IMP dehydrogenase